MRKVDVVVTGLQGCFGCLLSLIHLWGGDRELFNEIELKYSPIQDTKVMPNAKIGIIEGAVGDNDQEETLKEMREKVDILIAVGTCAAYGGIAGLRNLFQVQDVLDRSYIESESTKAGEIPGPPSLPELTNCIKPLSAFVEVDQNIPGCPPSDQLLKTIMQALQRGE